MILQSARTFEVQSETFLSWVNQNQSMSTNVLLHKYVRMWLQKIQLFCKIELWDHADQLQARI